ncbi:hypothetical protein DRJ19_02625 [Candidatus Woesearchaeota archaeon]|nr:MAG: hypothetical protein DRJ19_02625 [Candidatus Woesearchaeota archaeon]
MKVSVVRDPALKGVYNLVVTISVMDVEEEKELEDIYDRMCRESKELMEFSESGIFTRYFGASTLEAGETAIAGRIVYVPQDAVVSGRKVPAMLEIIVKVPGGIDESYVANTMKRLLPPKLFAKFVERCAEVGIPIRG